jgi:hypothetical protein
MSGKQDWRFSAIAAALSLSVYLNGTDVLARGADRAPAATQAAGLLVEVQQRTDRPEPGLQPDPIGNAIIGGAVTGTLRGAAAGAISTLRGGAIGAAGQALREDIDRSRLDNQQSGRGGANDPRYDPRTLFSR